MAWTRTGFFLAAALALSAAFSLPADAACSDKKIVAMANDGRTVNAIAKACNMQAAKVRGVIQQADADDEAPASAAQDPRPQRTPPAELVKKLPSDAGVALCDCQGTVPYGEKAPEQRCQSGMSMAMPCAGYCSPQGVAPWRRICS